MGNRAKCLQGYVRHFIKFLIHIMKEKSLWQWRRSEWVSRKNLWKSGWRWRWCECLNGVGEQLSSSIISKLKQIYSNDLCLSFVLSQKISFLYFLFLLLLFLKTFNVCEHWRVYFEAYSYMRRKLCGFIYMNIIFTKKWKIQISLWLYKNCSGCLRKSSLLNHKIKRPLKFIICKRDLKGLSKFHNGGLNSHLKRVSEKENPKN